MIKIPKSDFIKEHKHLIKLLESFNSKAAKKEAASQKKELSEIVGSGDLSKTVYDAVYPEDVLNILGMMTFGEGLLMVGSSSLRSQLYAGDYDGHEVVEVKKSTDAEALTFLRSKFQSMIAKLKATKDVYITDFKSGSVPEWEILDPKIHIKDGKVLGYDCKKSRERVKELETKKILSPTEAAAALKLLKPRLTVAQYALAKDELKYHTIRWNVLEIAKNKKVLRDGRIVTLEETFNMPALTKLDCVGLVQRSRYTEFSVIYEFFNNGKALNPQPAEAIAQSLADDIELYKAKGNYYKALKRQFALAKLEDKNTILNRLTEVFNSDLGRLYQIISDIATLQLILKTAPVKNIKYAVDQFKTRLSNVWETQPYLKLEPLIIKDIKALLKTSKAKMNTLLERLGNRIDMILQAEAKKYL